MLNIPGKFLEKIKTKNFKLNFFFRKSCRSRDNVKNTIDLGRLQMTWQRHIALGITMSTDTYTKTHTDYVTFIAFTLQQSLHEGT
jgi:hypothetical protein